jgi:hypothetical protein
MSRCSPLLATLSTALGLLLSPVALPAEPARAAAPGVGSSPSTPAEALGAALDEIDGQVQWLIREATILHRELAAARERIATLEAARAEDAATIADLRAELERARAEASRRRVEQLDASLALTPVLRVPGTGGSGAVAYYVAIEPVNLRVAPTTAAEVLAVIGQGAVVRDTGGHRGWLQVEYTDADARALTGWVYSEFLRSVETPPR